MNKFKFKYKSVWSEILDRPRKEKPIILRCTTCGIILESMDKQYWECPKCKRTFMKEVA